MMPSVSPCKVQNNIRSLWYFIYSLQFFRLKKKSSFHSEDNFFNNKIFRSGRYFSINNHTLILRKIILHILLGKCFRPWSWDNFFSYIIQKSSLDSWNTWYWEIPWGSPYYFLFVFSAKNSRVSGHIFIILSFSVEKYSYIHF